VPRNPSYRLTKPVTHRGFVLISLATSVSESVLDSCCPTCGIWLASFYDKQVLAGAASLPSQLLRLFGMQTAAADYS
jgi:hypothetical protein